MPADNAMITQARLEITHRCDGPITPFVLISRACRLATYGRPVQGMNPTHDAGWAAVVAEALYAELAEYGWLTDDDSAVEPTGS